MKFIGIVGSNADLSYNRKLLQFIKKEYSNIAEIEILEINELPIFNQSKDISHEPLLQSINRKIMQADGVIIATPEHNHTIPAALKSFIEWISFTIHPLENKPVLIVGASYFEQGSSRAQLHLRQILDAPGVNAIVMPGNEFLLGRVREAFDAAGNLVDKGTVDFLRTILNKFKRFVSVVSVLEDKPKHEPEDLDCLGSIDTTIKNVDMRSENWVEEASKEVGAAKGSDYVQLNHGVLTVDQLNYFLSSMPLELTYADHNNQFLYYNYVKEEADMLASRRPGQVGNPLSECHPEKALKGVEWVVQTLRSGQQDMVRVHVPTHGPDKFVVHNYQAMHNPEGEYVGINEYILDLKPWVDFYLQQTGQTLVGDVDATSSASVADNDTDATSSASVKG